MGFCLSDHTILLGLMSSSIVMGEAYQVVDVYGLVLVNTCVIAYLGSCC
jgi:hypothetical protein